MPSRHKPKAAIATPMKSIRLACLGCTGFEPGTVRNCPRTDCQLYSRRMGKRPPAGTSPPPLRSIRLYCLACCNGHPLEVRLCPVLSCPLFGYRFGRRPSTNPKQGTENGRGC